MTLQAFPEKNNVRFTKRRYKIRMPANMISISDVYHLIELCYIIVTLINCGIKRATTP